MALHTLERLDPACLPEITLSKGSHQRRGEGTCAMEAAAWLAGEPHSDAPACVSPVIRAFVVRFNDRLPDDATRDRLLKPLLPLILDTADPALERRRGYMAADWAIHTAAPSALDLAPATKGWAGRLRALPLVIDPESADVARKEARAAYDAAYAAAAAAYDAAYAAAAAAYAAADAAADAAYAAAAYAAYAADAAADAAAYAAAYAAAAREPLWQSAVELIRAMCALSGRAER